MRESERQLCTERSRGEAAISAWSSKGRKKKKLPEYEIETSAEPPGQTHAVTACSDEKGFADCARCAPDLEKDTARRANGEAW